MIEYTIPIQTDSVETDTIVLDCYLLQYILDQIDTSPQANFLEEWKA
jgi:hypothetical protein